MAARNDCVFLFSTCPVSSFSWWLGIRKRHLFLSPKLSVLPLKESLWCGSEEGADLLWPEGVGVGGEASQQRVLQGVLHAELLKLGRR